MTSEHSMFRITASGQEFEVYIDSNGDIQVRMGTSDAGLTISFPSPVSSATSALASLGVSEQAGSIAIGVAGYTDTASTIFTEPWADLTNWAQGGNPTQVSGNVMYAKSPNGSGSGGNHSYALAAGDSLRWLCPVIMLTGGGSGGAIVGVNSDTAGAAPTAGAGASFGLFFQAGSTDPGYYNNGVLTTLSTQNAFTSATYLVTTNVDSTYISCCCCKESDGTGEVYARRLRASFTVNNIYTFNSDGRFTSGIGIGLCSARKGMQTITPRTYGESAGKTIIWSGDGSTANWLICVPASYDTRKPLPVALCFHGSGTDETAWISNATYVAMQRALVAAGYIVMSASSSTTTTGWGNTVSTTAYYTAYKYVRDNFSIGPVVMLAGSMGGVDSLNALARNQIPGVVAWCGVSPATNLATAYADSTFTSAITNAYNISGSNYATQTAGHDPNLMAPDQFRGLPMLFLAATDDTVIPKTTNTDLLAANVAGISSAVTVTAGITGGHSFPITAYLSTITTFFNQYVKSV